MVLKQQMENHIPTNQEIAIKLSRYGLKITPQRVAVLGALIKLCHHPSAEDIFREVVQVIPGLSQATVYNTLDVLVQRGIASKIATSTGVMRYDLIEQPHHHLFDETNSRIEDYYDPELDQILKMYFSKKKIKGFVPLEIKLHVIGAFRDNVV